LQHNNPNHTEYHFT